MSCFKRKQYILAALVIPAIIVACAKAPERADGQADSGTFVIDPVTATSSEHQAKDSWNLKRADLLTLHACIKDIGYLQPIVGQTFIIQNGEHEQSVITNAQGCVTWNESLEFDYVAPETYVEQERVFIATRPHRGTQTVSIALNPWRTDPTALMDLRYSSVPRLASGGSASHALISSRSSAEPDGAAELIAETIGIELFQESTTQAGADLGMRLTLHPQVARKHLDGVSRPEPLKSGELKLSLALIERVGDSRSVLARNEVEGRIENGILSIQDKLHLTRLPRKNALLEMAYHLDAVGTASAIRAEDGVFQMTSLALSGNIPRQRLSISFAAYLGGNETILSENVAMGNTCSDGSDRFGFFFDDWTIEHGGVLKTTPKEGVPSEVGISIRTCLKNPIDRKAVAGQPVSVQLLDANGAEGPTSSRTTDSQGCLFWSERIRFDYFQPERWFQRSIKVTSTQAPFENVSKTLPIQINPWQSRNFSWDCRSGSAPRTGGGKTAQLDVTELAYSFLGQDFALDRYLNLTFKRKYQLRMAPAIRRHTAFDKNVVSESLNEGKYRLRVLLLSPNDTGDRSLKNAMNNFKYLSSYESEVQARGGMIIEEITLPVDFSELPLVAGRNEIVIELAPVGRSSLKAVTVTAPFSSLSESGGSGMMSSRQSLAEISERLAPAANDPGELARVGKDAKARRKSTREAPTALYRKAFDLRELSTQNIQQESLLQSDVDALLASTTSATSAARKFCGLLFNDTLSKIRCKAFPSKSLNIFATRHVEKILGEPDQRGADVTTISINAAMVHDSSESNNTSTGATSFTSTSVGGKVGFGLSTPSSSPVRVSGGAEFSVSKGKSWYTTQQVTHSNNRSSSVSLSFLRNLTTERLDFAVDARIRTCVVIAPTSGGSAGFHICPRNTVKRERITESWYYVFQAFSNDSSPLRDTGDIGNRPWLTALRGKPTFGRFRSLLEDRTKTIAIVHDQQYEQLGRALTDAAQSFVNTVPKYSEGAFPGLYTQ